MVWLQGQRLLRGLQLYIAVFTRVASLGLLTLSAATAEQNTAPNVYLSAQQSTQQSTQQSLAVNSQSDNHYPQYTEAACILIAGQIKRFEQQRHLPAYQDALRNQQRHCITPLVSPAKNIVLTKPEPSRPHAPVTLSTGMAEEIEAKQPTVQALSATNAPHEAIFYVLLGGFSGFLQALLMFLLGLVCWRVGIKFIGQTNSARLGRLAERQLGGILKKHFQAGYSHYHNLVLPSTQGDLTEIDYLLVSPFGIFVFEVKNYQGWIFGAAQQEQWVVKHFRRQHSFQNPIRQNYKHTEALAQLLELDGNANAGNIYSVIVFTRRAEFKTQIPDNVLYIDDAAYYVDHICAQGRRFSDEALLRYTSRLNLFAAEAEQLRKQHKLQQQGQQLLRELNQRDGLSN